MNEALFSALVALTKKGIVVDQEIANDLARTLDKRHVYNQSLRGILGIKRRDPVALLNVAVPPILVREFRKLRPITRDRRLLFDNYSLAAFREISYAYQFMRDYVPMAPKELPATNRAFEFVEASIYLKKKLANLRFADYLYIRLKFKDQSAYYVVFAARPR